jgi:hypothetical protein
VIDDHEHRAVEIFARLGRKAKLALAARNAHSIREHLDDLDHAVRAAILDRCDKYAADARAKGDR